MGEIFDQMAKGYICVQCGRIIDGESPGSPRSCEACRSPRNRGEIPMKDWDDAEAEWHETREGGLPE